jgi:hypothetical protein
MARRRGDMMRQEIVMRTAARSTSSRFFARAKCPWFSEARCLTLTSHFSGQADAVSRRIEMLAPFSSVGEWSKIDFRESFSSPNNSPIGTFDSTAEVDRDKGRLGEIQGSGASRLSLRANTAC